MAGSTYTALHVHVVFATFGRTPWLQASWRPRLHAMLGGIAKTLGVVPVEVGGVADHVHLLLSCGARTCIADVVRELKKASHGWIMEGFAPAGFRWQEGYGAFSVSLSAVPAVRRYIAGQEEHHRHRTFDEEWTDFLRLCGERLDIDAKHPSANTKAL
jgi:REP element-mobilizing transposase RayT